MDFTGSFGFQFLDLSTQTLKQKTLTVLPGLNHLGHLGLREKFGKVCFKTAFSVLKACKNQNFSSGCFQIFGPNRPI